MPVLRLPNNGSRWVWQIDKDHARTLIEVVHSRYNGEEWWVKSRVLPDYRSRELIDSATNEPQNELDLFWESVTPVGGRLEDLSNPISERQYRPTRQERP